MAAPRRGTDVLGVFVKAPVAGRVKTRLAAEVGARRAAGLYRRLGRRTVAACVSPAYETVVWFAPASARSGVGAWLGGLGVAAFRAQSDAGLGARLAAAFAQHFRAGARCVILIGSDCPGVDRPLVARAFAALDEHDLVLGPARDGGYYLVGLRAPAAALFRGIAWSTAAVLERTLTRARRLGLDPVLLARLRDVDTVADARALGLIGSSTRREGWE